MEDFRKLIADRRDGKRHTFKEFQIIADSAAKGLVPDYQLSAWLMAAYLNPLDMSETTDLTKAMAATGVTLNLSRLMPPHVDKHSTGGVGDKTTLVLLPVLAVCGLRVVKMSGPGLGITGGTIDKLHSIPGFNTSLTPEEMLIQAERIGIALSGQSADLAPADKVLYGLRDATATTESLPLIVSSILSKKVAGGAEIIMLDVKCGSGAFMPTLPKARELARALKEVGARCGLQVQTEITDMSQPLGSAVGNSLEVAEALGVLGGSELAPSSLRFKNLCRKLAASTLVYANRCETEAEALRMVDNAFDSGRALDKFELWVAAQGGSKSLIDIFEDLPVARFKRAVYAEKSGWIAKIDARTVGEVVIELGGGRKQKGDQIDYAVGVEVATYVGRPVKEGDTLFTVHGQGYKQICEAGEKLIEEVTISDRKVKERPLILERI